MNAHRAIFVSRAAVLAKMVLIIDLCISIEKSALPAKSGDKINTPKLLPDFPSFSQPCSFSLVEIDFNPTHSLPSHPGPAE
jgi:hypothetical protein